MTDSKVEVIDGIKHYFTKIGQQITITAYHNDKDEIDRIANRLSKIADSVEISSRLGEWKAKAVSNGLY